MRIYNLVEAESLWALSQRGAVNLPQVKELQDKLRAAGHDPGPSDGWYGQNTANAVRAYQAANGLKVDGDAGPKTLAKIGLAGAEKTPPKATPPEKTPPKAAPRNPATEPKTVAPVTTTKPKQTTAQPKQTTNIQTSGSIIQLSSNPSSGEMRRAIKNLNLPVRFERFEDYGDYFAMELQSTQLSRADGREAGARLNNQIVDALESRLKADWGDKKIDFLLRGTDGNSLDYPRDVFLDPAPKTAPKQTTTTNTKVEPKTQPTQANNIDDSIKKIVADDPSIKSFTFEKGILTLIIDRRILKGYQEYLKQKEKGAWTNTNIKDAFDQYGFNDGYINKLKKDIPEVKQVIFKLEASKQKSTNTVNKSTPTFSLKPNAEDFKGAATTLSLLSPKQLTDATGAFMLGGAAYGTAAFKQINEDAFAYVGIRHSSMSGTTYAMYAFSKSSAKGYQIKGRADFDDPNDAAQALRSLKSVGRSYPLNAGSSQYERRERLLKYLTRMAQLKAKKRTTGK